MTSVQNIIDAEPFGVIQGLCFFTNGVTVLDNAA